MTEILEISKNKKIKADIIPAGRNQMPLKKDGWNFNWRQLIKNENTATFILKLVEAPQTIEGVVQLRIEAGMLIMDLVEIAPHNVGKNKRYEDVAGCLIAFACRESFRLEGPYKGFLTFESKTVLMDWYAGKYGAHHTIGRKMHIDPQQGRTLIDKYLNTELGISWEIKNI